MHWLHSITMQINDPITFLWIKRLFKIINIMNNLFNLFNLAIYSLKGNNECACMTSLILKSCKIVINLIPLFRVIKTKSFTQGQMTNINRQ